MIDFFDIYSGACIPTRRYPLLHALLSGFSVCVCFLRIGVGLISCLGEGLGWMFISLFFLMRSSGCFWDALFVFGMHIWVDVRICCMVWFFDCLLVFLSSRYLVSGGLRVHWYRMMVVMAF